MQIAHANGCLASMATVSNQVDTLPEMLPMCGEMHTRQLETLPQDFGHNMQGSTPLHCACVFQDTPDRDYLPEVQALVEAGADTAAVNKVGFPSWKHALHKTLARHAQNHQLTHHMRTLCSKLHAGS